MSTAFANQPPAGMSIDVEDWFMASNLASAVDASSWSRRESRVEANTDRVLQGLADHGITGTFFVLGWVAERFPTLIDRIGGAGHELAAHGMNHEPVHSLSVEAFRDDVRRCKGLLEQRTGHAVHGYRAPDFSITEWAVDVLQEVGFTYDSSAFPMLGNQRYGTLRDMDARDPVREILADADVHCYNHKVLDALVGEVLRQDGHRGQLVHRHIEEPLNLRRVQVHGQHPVGPGGGQQVRHQPRRYRHPGLVFLVGSPVAVVGHHCGDAPGRCPLAGVYHYQQFHQVVVDRGADGLDDKHVPLADVLQDTHEGVVVGELERLDLPTGIPR